MSIFEPSTPVETSPEGQEVETAEEQSFEEEIEQEQEIHEEDYESADEESDEEEAPLENEGQEQLIAGKFKSQDDLVKAYKNLEREFHKSRQQPSQPQQPIQQQPQQDINELFWTQFQQDPFGTMNQFVNAMVEQRTAGLYEQQQTQTVSQHFQSLSNEFPQLATEQGMSEFANKIFEVAEELGNPNLAANPSPRIMKLAAMEAFGDSKASLYKKAKQQGRMEAENARRAKQGLSAPKQTKPKQVEKSPEELIADSIVSAGSRRGLFG